MTIIACDASIVRIVTSVVSIADATKTTYPYNPITSVSTANAHKMIEVQTLLKLLMLSYLSQA